MYIEYLKVMKFQKVKIFQIYHQTLTLTPSATTLTPFTTTIPPFLRGQL